MAVAQYQHKIRKKTVSKQHKIKKMDIYQTHVIIIKKKDKKLKSNFLIKKYKQRYSIPYIDLADAAESNRLILLFITPLLFLFGFLDLIAIFIIHHADLINHISSIIYFSFFTVLSIFIFFYCRSLKDINRNKAYVLKTIPCYILLFSAFGTAIYNFYILQQPFNGFILYCLTGFITLCVFSFSPIIFFIGLTIGMLFLGPGVYQNFGPSGLADSILSALLMFFLSLYKRHAEKKHILFLKKQKQNLEAKTFGNFTLIYENKVIKFSRKKSEELLGYLIYKKGSSVKTKELISVLYGEYADSARYGSSLRNLIVDIKHTLNELEIQNFFIAEYNNFRINPEVIKCDYYDFLSGESNAIHDFAGEFMSQFSWAEDIAGFLSMKALKK